MIKKRIGIFAFYDKSGTVKKYVKYLLRQMRTFLSECCIVCNGYITDESKEWLKANLDYVFFRENKGYDAEAYQDVILNRLGLPKLREFDELVLFNNSFYGPIYSFENMFGIMEQKKVDFWGITAFKGEHIPYHIQSYFLVIRDRVLNSDVFEEYWKCQKECNAFQDAIKNFELKITDYFVSRGYSCSTYIDYLNIKEDYGAEMDLLNVANYELLVEKNCPIVKRKYIMWPLEYALLQNNTDILEYIKEYTNYNIDLIWEDLIKEYSPYELTTYRNLNYYLTDSVSDSSIVADLEDVCVVIVSTQPEQFIDYLERQLCKVSIIICTDKELSKYENAGTIKRNGQLLNEVLFKAGNLKKEVRYLCVLKDSLIVRGKLAEKRRNYGICRKLVSSLQYMGKVKKLFEQQPYLGALFAEELVDEDYLLQGFYKHYLSENQVLLLEKTGCNVMVGERYINHSGCFWVKTDVLKVIEKNNSLYEHILEREILALFPYFVKMSGHYSGMISNIDVLAKEYTVKDVLLNELMENVVFINKSCFERQILEENILKFVKRFQDIYIYGAGKYAKKVIIFLERKGIAVKGIFVTSKESDLKFMGYPIYEINEVQLSTKAGVIVAMSRRNQEEIKKNMKWHSEENIYYV